MITTLSFQKSAHSFEEKFPVTATQIKKKSYVDDLGITGRNKQEVCQRTKEADSILEHANMKVKKWIYSGDSQEFAVGVGNAVDVVFSEGVETERMLGILWYPAADVFKFSVKINLSPLKNKSRTGPDLSKNDLLKNPPEVLTRRQYYSQVQSLFDPIGFLAPVLLRAKVLLRRTWEDSCANLKWDDPLPRDIVKEMIQFFV